MYKIVSSILLSGPVVAAARMEKLYDPAVKPEIEYCSETIRRESDDPEFTSPT